MHLAPRRSSKAVSSSRAWRGLVRTPTVYLLGNLGRLPLLHHVDGILGQNPPVARRCLVQTASGEPGHSATPCDQAATRGTALLLMSESTRRIASADAWRADALNRPQQDTVRPRNQEVLLSVDPRLPVISLFSGAGGLDLAAERCPKSPSDLDVLAESLRPLRVVVATDYDSQALATLSKNSPGTSTVCGDIRQTSTAELLEAGDLSVGDAALVIGGPPCTPFSKSGFWLEEKRTSMDPNASLLDEYVRVVREARPEAFVLENVQGLTYRTHIVQFERLLTGLRDLGYNPRWKVLLAADYGVPQLRRRVFVVGRRDGERFVFPPSTHSGWSERYRIVDAAKLPYVTTRQVLSDLLPGDPEDEEVVEGEFAELAAEVPPGQNYLWHTSRYDGRNVFKWRSRYWTFLLRLDPDRPSTTLQAQPGPWVGPFHWENVPNVRGDLRARRLRVPEMLRIMTFPDDFVIVGSRVDAQRQLGNAVPVDLGKVVIRALLEQLGHLAPDSTPATCADQLELPV
jgi:DNA (cytosine-5)-methyltransferase 1